MEKVRFSPLGDRAMSLILGNTISRTINRRQSQLIKALVKVRDENIVDGLYTFSPTYCSIMVRYNPRVIDYYRICDLVRELENNLADDTEDPMVRIVEFPTCYEEEFALDMDFVSKHTGLSPQEIIKIHSERDYLVYMLGFLPGFTYLGGMDPRLTTPRLKTPRTKIPKGSVGIAGAQTGTYPSESPGGWQIIGRTPLNLYDMKKEKPALVEAGNYVRYVPISRAEYDEIERLGNDFKIVEYICKESEIRGYDPNS